MKRHILAYVTTTYGEDEITATMTRKGHWAIRGGGYRFNRLSLTGVTLGLLLDKRPMRVVYEGM